MPALPTYENVATNGMADATPGRRSPGLPLVATAQLGVHGTEGLAAKVAA